MPYAIHYRPSGHVVELSFRSPDSLQEHLSAGADIVRLVERYACHRVLVDLGGLTASTSLTRQEQMAFADAWPADAVRQSVFAIVLPESDIHQQDWYFVIHLVRSRGSTGEPFFTRDEALEWLLSKRARD